MPPPRTFVELSNIWYYKLFVGCCTVVTIQLLQFHQQRDDMHVTQDNLCQVCYLCLVLYVNCLIL